MEVPTQSVLCSSRASKAGAKLLPNLPPKTPCAAIARSQWLGHIYEATHSLPRWSQNSALLVVPYRAGAVTLPAGSRCLTGSSCHLQFLEQTKHFLHVSPSFLGVWNFMQPQEHSGLHRPQPSGIPPRTGSRLRLGVGRVLTLSVDVQCVDSGHVGQTPHLKNTAVSLCLCRKKINTFCPRCAGH